MPTSRFCTTFYKIKQFDYNVDWNVEYGNVDDVGVIIKDGQKAILRYGTPC